jgi:hypothetical protein
VGFLGGHPPEPAQRERTPMDTTTVAQPTTREQRGLELYRERRGEFVRISKDVTEVPGSKRGVYYRTNLGVGSCSAPIIAGAVAPASISRRVSFTAHSFVGPPPPSRTR